jgi:hypothetical protein
MAIGPIELVVLGFKGDESDVARKVDQAINATPILRDIQRVSDIRIIDLLLMKKDAHGKLERCHTSELTPQQQAFSGVAANALIGGVMDTDDRHRTGGILHNIIQSAKGVVYDAGVYDSGVFDSGLNEVQVQEMTRHIPSNTVIAMVLLEHRWAAHLMDGVKDIGGMLILDGIVTPATLSMFRAQLAAAEAVADQHSTA